MTRRTVPVRIRGIDYPSIVVAARALGISPATIGKMLDNGCIDNAGLGRNHNTRVEIFVDGKSYPSIEDAASRIGVSGKVMGGRRLRAMKKGRTSANINGMEFRWA